MQRRSKTVAKYIKKTKIVKKKIQTKRRRVI